MGYSFKHTRFLGAALLLSAATSLSACHSDLGPFAMPSGYAHHNEVYKAPPGPEPVLKKMTEEEKPQFFAEGLHEDKPVQSTSKKMPQLNIPAQTEISAPVAEDDPVQPAATLVVLQSGPSSVSSPVSPAAPQPEPLAQPKVRYELVKLDPVKQNAPVVKASKSPAKKEYMADIDGQQKPSLDFTAYDTTSLPGTKTSAAAAMAEPGRFNATWYMAVSDLVHVLTMNMGPISKPVYVRPANPAILGENDFVSAIKNVLISRDVEFTNAPGPNNFTLDYSIGDRTNADAEGISVAMLQLLLKENEHVMEQASDQYRVELKGSSIRQQRGQIFRPVDDSLSSMGRVSSPVTEPYTGEPVDAPLPLLPN